MSENQQTSPVVEFTPDVVDLLGRVYAAGIRSGAASMLATGLQRQGIDPGEREEASIARMSTVIRDVFASEFRNDPTIRHELVTEWQGFADDVAAGHEPGGVCTCGTHE